MPRTWTIFLAAAALSLSACEDLAAPVEEPGSTVGDPAGPPNDPAVAFVSTRNGSPHIYVADADGSHVADLGPGRSPAWSWDGRRIAFVRDRPGTGSALIYVMNADGTGARAVTEGFAPSWTPTGRITFHSQLPWPPADPTQGGILVVNADGTGRALLLPHAWAKSFNNDPGYGTESVQFPTSSPDARLIAFWLYGGYSGHKSIGLINADGSSPAQFLSTNPISVWGRVAWAPDGSRILYGNGGGQQIVSVPLNGGTPAVHYSRVGRFPQEADWSPDGGEVVFSDGVAYPTTQLRIFVVTLASGAVRQLIPDAVSPALRTYDDTEPAWSRVRK